MKYKFILLQTNKNSTVTVEFFPFKKVSIFLSKVINRCYYYNQTVKNNYIFAHKYTEIVKEKKDFYI